MELRTKRSHTLWQNKGRALREKTRPICTDDFGLWKKSGGPETWLSACAPGGNSLGVPKKYTRLADYEYIQQTLEIQGFDDPESNGETR